MRFQRSGSLVAAVSITRALALSLQQPMAAPGTLALRSPPGFEATYARLREIRAATGKPLVSLAQLRKIDAPCAEKLATRVDFNVPRTRREAAATFFAHPTARFIVAAFLAAVTARVRCAPPLGFDDAAAVALTAPAWCVQEWLIHARLLHASRPWHGGDIHRWHHELPYLHVSLDGLDLAAAWFVAVGVIAVGAGRLFAGALPACLSALATYTFCGGCYEAAHYLAHTAVPLPPYLASLRRHHTLHHTLSQDNWLAFTTPAVDTLFGTNPRPLDVVRARRKGG